MHPLSEREKMRYTDVTFHVLENFWYLRVTFIAHYKQI